MIKKLISRFSIRYEPGDLVVFNDPYANVAEWRKQIGLVISDFPEEGAALVLVTIGNATFQRKCSKQHLTKIQKS